MAKKPKDKSTKPLNDTELIDWLSRHVICFMNGPEPGRFGYEFSTRAEPRKAYIESFRDSIHQMMSGNNKW